MPSVTEKTDFKAHLSHIEEIDINTPELYSLVQSDNTAFWCRTIEDVIGVIHDSAWNYYHDIEVQKHANHSWYKMQPIHVSVSEIIARKVINHFIADGRAEVVPSHYPGIYTTPEKTLGWVIHSTEYTKGQTPAPAAKTP